MKLDIKDVYINFWLKPKPEFTEYQLALMEGGHSLEPPKDPYPFLKTLSNKSPK